MAAQSSETGPGAEPGPQRSGPQPPRSQHPGPQPPDQGRAGHGQPEVEPEPGHHHWSLPGSRLWRTHSAELARATAIDLALLAGHVLLYPTGMLPEREHSPAPAPPPADTTDAADAAAGPRTRATSHNKPSARPPAEHPPVLLLHGFVDNRSALTLLRRSLLRHGWPRVQAVNYSPLTSDIRTAAELLGPVIEQVCARSGHSEVDIVAHSLGGLVARYYAQCLGGDAYVRTLVTLGTPHAGTRAVPALAPHPLARQMRPGSPVLEELAGPAKGCRTRFVAFWSNLDQLMIPVESARLEHPDLRAKNVLVTGIGHLALPVHTAVAAEIRRALTENGPLRNAIDAA